jgi:hypothetical protein
MQPLGVEAIFVLMRFFVLIRVSKGAHEFKRTEVLSSQTPPRLSSAWCPGGKERMGREHSRTPILPTPSVSGWLAVFPLRSYALVHPSAGHRRTSPGDGLCPWAGAHYLPACLPGLPAEPAEQMHSGATAEENGNQRLLCSQPGKARRAFKPPSVRS